jgi:glucuronoarabinoxylan endo-1,4-beta-xylanase
MVILAIVATAPAFDGGTRVNAASDITVDLNATKQTIRGFGGMNHPIWISDLTDSQRTTAFGNGDGQIGMSILRIHVDENSNNWSQELATAKRAVALGAIVFASPWNPPSSMTEVVNGQKRLRYNQYGAYANHLNSFVSYMKQNGVDIYAISIQNEPDYAAEWTAWTPQEILNFMKSNAGSIQTRVIAPESFQYRKVMSDPILNDTQALANMDILGAHLYGTQLRDFPYPLFKQKGQGKELWMTEVYTESSNDANAWPLALDVAYNIHNSMVEAEFNAYVWWYIRRSYGLIKDDGQVSKRGYAMAQYSKFIRPGYVRVDATKNPTSDVYVSAYKSGQNVVVVVVNRSASSKNLSLSVNGANVQSFTKYTTSGSKNVRNDGTVSNSNGGFALSLDAQSVTTFVSSLAGPTVTPTRTPTPVTPTPVTPTPVTPTPVTPTPVTSTPATATPVTPTPVTPTATPGSGTPCSPVTGTVTAPFSYDGAGTFCWQIASIPNYINSWNLTSLKINGVDFSNIYAVPSSLPPKINGYWYVSYSGSYAWSHFEAK